MSNAVQFTERGEVVLRVSKVRTDAARATLAFALCDTGIGLLSDGMALIEQFNRDSRIRGEPQIEIGTGIATGEVVADYAGTRNGATYSCIVDTVYLAARPETHTKVKSVSVLMDQTTRDANTNGLPLIAKQTCLSRDPQSRA